MNTETGDRPVISKNRAEQDLGPGGETIIARAVAAGVIKPHRTPTGREYLTPNQFEALFRFSRSDDAQRR